MVARIYQWRIEERIGIPAITGRLNAARSQYPPPAGGRWVESTVGAILANPKYTDHPRTISIRQDILLTLIRQFFNSRPGQQRPR